MKAVWLIALCALLMAGCSKNYETMNDAHLPIEPAAAKIAEFSLPQDAALPVVSGEGGKIYFCDGYEIVYQTLDGGNLDKTLREMTGFGRKDLTVVQTNSGGIDRYSCVWTSAGEAGDQVGKLVILDDGHYHYCLGALASSQEAGSLQTTWASLLGSFRVHA